MQSFNLRLFKLSHGDSENDDGSLRLKSLRLNSVVVGAKRRDKKETDEKRVSIKHVFFFFKARNGVPVFTKRVFVKCWRVLNVVCVCTCRIDSTQKRTLSTTCL